MPRLCQTDGLSEDQSEILKAVRQFVDRLGGETPVLMSHEDLMLWHAVHPDGPAPEPLSDGQQLLAGSVALTVLATPGHSPGSVVFHAPDLGDHGVLFTGDTRSREGPGPRGAPTRTSPRSSSRSTSAC